MAMSQADVDALEAAIATGALQVRYADNSSVTYRSQAELERALRMAKAAVTPAADQAPRGFVIEF